MLLKLQATSPKELQLQWPLSHYPIYSTIQIFDYLFMTINCKHSLSHLLQVIVVKYNVLESLSPAVSIKLPLYDAVLEREHIKSMGFGQLDRANLSQGSQTA